MELMFLNYPAILVAAIGTFVLGAIWYSPLLFARAWMKANGISEADLPAMQASAKRAYLVSFLCYLVVATAVAILVNRMNIGTLFGGIKLGLVLWVGFAAAIGLTSNMFSNKPLTAYLIDAGYQLVYLLGMSVLLAVWW